MDTVIIKVVDLFFVNTLKAHPAHYHVAVSGIPLWLTWTTKGASEAEITSFLEDHKALGNITKYGRERNPSLTLAAIPI